jgi:membrane-associated phospholipid phosphatase
MPDCLRQIALSAVLACGLSVQAQSVQAQTSEPAGEPHRRKGDALSFALPAGVALAAWWQDRQSPPPTEDDSEFRQWALSFTVTMGATELLKRSVNSQRPDRRDNLSFPSGHAARAFSAATFVHRRAGFESAWPLYAAATYVGWTRVDANRHRWFDVLGAAGLSAALSWTLASPRLPHSSAAGAVSAWVQPGAAQVVWHIPL